MKAEGTLERLFVGENVATRLGAVERQARLLARRTRGERQRFLVDGWRRTDVAANLSASTVARFAETADQELVMPFGYRVVGLFVAMSAARTGGTLTTEVYVAGSASGLEMDVDAVNTQGDVVWGNLWVDSLEAVTIRLTTTSGWTPTTADLKAGIFIEVGE
jgi:hypothetical protein